jgi:hypothetical protein
MPTSPVLTPLTEYHFITKNLVTNKKLYLVHNISAKKLKTAKKQQMSTQDSNKLQYNY